MWSSCSRQFKRLKQVLRRQRTILGVLMRDVQRKMVDLSDAAQRQLQDLLDRVARIHAQTASKANPSGRGKLYEFGVKSSLAVTHGQGLIVGARTFPGNPYDGHTLTGKQRRWLKRRQAVEPVIGHVKQDHGMQRCWLKGSEGDALHAVLCAAGYNLRWLLRAIARKGLKALFAPFLLLALWLAWLVSDHARASNRPAFASLINSRDACVRFTRCSRSRLLITTPSGSESIDGRMTSV